MLNKVISVCAIKDLEAWAVAAPQILRFIRALHYEVIVPDDQVESFVKRTPSAIKVVAESFYLGAFSLAWCKSQMPEWAHSRAGWYLQQIIKISALGAGRPGQTALIWDADTVPLRPLHFFNDSGCLQYYRGRDKPEFWTPYFETLQSLAGFDRCAPHSFISQSFPVRVEWVQAFQIHVEQRHGVPWPQAIMAALDHTKGGCCFSEYETLGNFFYQHWPDSMVFSPRTHFREGTRLIGRAIDVHNPEWSRLPEWIDYIAFEEYQTGRYRGLNLGCGNDVKEKTFRGNYFINSDLDFSPWSDFEFDITKPWPFPDGYFEHLMAMNVLEHVDDLIGVLREADRCLEVGGLLQFEVPYIGSHNHGTDVTHKRGFTFESFQFLMKEDEEKRKNYLFRNPAERPFDYKLMHFFGEVIDAGELRREVMAAIPERLSYGPWIDHMRSTAIPGTFGMVMQKVS